MLRKSLRDILVTILIIVTLIAITLPSLLLMEERRREYRVIGNIRIVASAVSDFSSYFGRVPADNDDLRLMKQTLPGQTWPQNPFSEQSWVSLGHDNGRTEPGKIEIHHLPDHELLRIIGYGARSQPIDTLDFPVPQRSGPRILMF